MNKKKEEGVLVVVKRPQLSTRGGMRKMDDIINLSPDEANNMLKLKHVVEATDTEKKKVENKRKDAAKKAAEARIEEINVQLGHLEARGVELYAEADELRKLHGIKAPKKAAE